MRCLVTGATGYVGGRLVPRLLARGYDVRAMARNPGKLADVPWRESAEVVRGDLGVADSLTPAFDGVDVVYYLVHSMGSSSNFAAAERRSARNVVAAARRAGVRRLVYLSGLHPSGAQLSPKCSNSFCPLAQQRPTTAPPRAVMVWIERWVSASGAGRTRTMWRARQPPRRPRLPKKPRSCSQSTCCAE